MPVTMLYNPFTLYRLTPLPPPPPPLTQTPMNMASTRSHCIFTVHISSREPGCSTIRKAKLHLVDLAGSERVGKTGAKGTLLQEAKYINTSLFFLEQVRKRGTGGEKSWQERLEGSRDSCSVISSAEQHYKL